MYKKIFTLSLYLLLNKSFIKSPESIYKDREKALKIHYLKRIEEEPDLIQRMKEHEIFYCQKYDIDNNYFPTDYEDKDNLIQKLKEAKKTNNLKNIIEISTIIGNNIIEERNKRILFGLSDKLKNEEIKRIYSQIIK
jgi:hypothetical protein